MSSTIHQIIFHFTFLFSVGTTFISNQSSINIDFSNNKGEITFINLETPLEVVDRAKSGLKELDKEIKFSTRFPHQLKLIDKKIYKKKHKLNATLAFSFPNTKSLEFLSFHRLPNKNFVYCILEDERILSCNGKIKIITKKGVKYRCIQWDKDIDKIELKIKHKKLKEYYLRNLVGLQKYWEE